MKTIAQLEAESFAAVAAYDDAVSRLTSLDNAIKALTVLEDIDLLTTNDEADISRMITRARIRRPLLVAEIDRLEDAKITAARALNDAPEEAE